MIELRRPLILLSSLALFAFVAGGCGDDDDNTSSTSSSSSSSSASGGSGGAGSGGAGGSGGMAPFEVTSTAFMDGETVPLQYECGPPLMGPGMNVSPQLSWTAGPAETQSYAVVVRDVDAMIPQYPEGIIHWVIYDIPVDALTLPEGIVASYEAAAPVGAKQADIQGNSYFGYFGPCSPNSVNTYVFTVHAMPTATLPGVTMASTESEIAAAIESTSIAKTSLAGES